MPEVNKEMAALGALVVPNPRELFDDMPLQARWNYPILGALPNVHVQGEGVGQSHGFEAPLVESHHQVLVE